MHFVELGFYYINPASVAYLEVVNRTFGDPGLPQTHTCVHFASGTEPLLLKHVPITTAASVLSGPCS